MARVRSAQQVRRAVARVYFHTCAHAVACLAQTPPEKWAQVRDAHMLTAAWRMYGSAQQVR